jgi:mannose-6-phosphate isomerase-like protein (cupin superfamily)
MNYLVNFDALTWESPTVGIRHKRFCVDSRVLRLVEYSREMVPHWCSKGHIGHVLSGSLEIEFATGTFHFDAGAAVFIPSGPQHAHRARVLTSIATALFVEDT